ncbi:MAG TPA: hypothetical protein VFU15_05840 [Bacteroidia bacterium]|nr:hypothetical protein [Bacteroidia bacterium]
MSAYHGRVRPAFSPVVSPLVPATFATKSKKIFAFWVASAIVGGIASAIGSGIAGAPGMYTGIGIGALMLVLTTIAALRSRHAKCPYCAFDVGSTTDVTISMKDPDLQVACPRCCEWLISDKGVLRAFTENDTQAKSKFTCPVFVTSLWPDECIVCGSPVVKYAQAKKTSVSVGRLLAGHLSVASGSVSNIPYCADHQDAVSLDVNGSELQLTFGDFGAMRRYLAMNPNRIRYKK